MELTDEEIDALKRAEEWLKRKDWRTMDDGYFEACVIALLLERVSKELKSLAEVVIQAATTI